MKLVRVEASGFKSFADTVTFELGAGVTAFVGPNGCGKSNVVDAIRWALGEQSVKALRGKEMADVIFNGCQGRPASGLAEVTLVFDNTSGRLPIPQAEVAVTRRLYRSGESEYLVNKQPCRLRDIRELFLDTGIGVEAYSVIEQGKVDLLLHANAQERRQIFEEAAGISRYRVKSRQAAARLERVDQNLLRIRDLVWEIERQLRSIKRQAARARRAQELQEEYRAGRLTLALHRRAGLAALQAELLGRQIKIQEEAAAAEALRAKFDGILAEAAAQREELARKVQEAAVDVARNESECLSLSEATRAQAARADDLGREKTAALREAQGARARGEAARARAQAAEGDVALLAQALAHQEEETRKLEAQAAGLRLEVEAAITAVEAHRADRMEAMRGRIALEAERAACRREEELLAARAARLAQKAHEIEAEIPAAQARVQSACARLAELVAEKQRASAKTVYYRGELASRLAEDAEKRAEVEILRYRLANAESAQERVKGGAGGFDPGGAGAQGSLGRVRDFIHASVGTFHAVESALGEHAGDWVVKDLSGALQVVDRASRRHGSEMGVFPIDRAIQRKGSGTWEDSPGFLGRAVDLVEADPGIRPVVEALLSGTLIVEDRAAALACLSRGGDFDCIVTLAGEVFDACGAIRYRSESRIPSGAASERVSRRRLEEEVMRVSSAIEQLEARRAEVRAKREEAQRILEEVDRLSAELDRQIQEARGMCDQETAQFERIVRERDLARGESEAIEQEKAAAAARAQEVSTKIEGLAPEATSPEDSAAGPAEAAENLAAFQNWKACEERLTASRAALEEAKARLVQRRQAAQAASQEAAQCDAEAWRLAQSAGALEERQAKDDAEALAREKRSEEIEKALGFSRQAAREAGEALERVRQDIAGWEQERAEARRKEEGAAAAANAARMEEREAALKLAAEEERAREELQIDLTQAAAGYADEARDWDALARRLEELRGELARTGGVDLEALSEEAELTRRHGFLAAQEADLTRAREGLADLIRRMNRTSRERFTETFERIRGNFQEAFRKLFGGGKADIKLDEEADILEAGIEIIARPPGKEPRSISLLSGGEKSMTAVALLFAVFQSRPSPFCILDEADAALDETNIDRFVGIVREFLVHSQFLVITHNKRTMRIADRLYGLTQQVPGISIPVTLAFEEIEKN